MANIPSHLHCRTLQELIAFVYGELRGTVPTPNIIQHRAILAGKNVDVDTVNDLQRLKGGIPN